MSISLKEKFYGCLTGIFAAAFLRHPEEQDDKAYKADAIGRINFLLFAIQKNNGRINANDLGDAIKHLYSVGNAKQPFSAEEMLIYNAISTGIPACNAGMLWDNATLNPYVIAAAPLGLINAGDPAHAYEDTLDVGTVYHIRNADSLVWAGAYAAAIAECCLPDATVDGVVETVKKYAYNCVEGSKIIADRLDSTVGCETLEELIEVFNRLFDMKGAQMAFYHASEAVIKGLCLFRLTSGDVDKVLSYASKLGRDFRSAAMIASGFCGAFRGADGFSVGMYGKEVSKKATALYEAYKQRLVKITAYLDMMGVV